MNQKKKPAQQTAHEKALEAVLEGSAPTLRRPTRDVISLGPRMIEPRTYTHKSTHEEEVDGKTVECVDFTVTVREQLGRDVGNSTYLRIVLRNEEKKQLGIPEKGELPDVYWENIAIISNAIVQTVETSGDIPFAMPRYSAPDDEIAAFYNMLLDLPGRYLAAFRDALRKVDERPAPLSGGQKDLPDTPLESLPD